jgi:hypothetical protein
LAQLGERSRQVDRRGGLADTTFLIGNGEKPAHFG